MVGEISSAPGEVTERTEQCRSTVFSKLYFVSQKISELPSDNAQTDRDMGRLQRELQPPLLEHLALLKDESDRSGTHSVASPIPASPYLATKTPVPIHDCAKRCTFFL
jgi:hypothetical protein